MKKEKQTKSLQRLLVNLESDPDIREALKASEAAEEHVGDVEMEEFYQRATRIARDALALPSAEKDVFESSDWLQPIVAWILMRQARMRAGSIEAGPFRLKRYAIEKTDFVLSVKTQLSDEACKISILKDGELSERLDGAIFLPSNGQAVHIVHGQGVCPISSLYPGGYRLLGKDGVRMTLRELNE